LALLLIEQLEQTYPNLEMTLNYTNAWELLGRRNIRCANNDEQVNRVTAELLLNILRSKILPTLTLEQLTEDIKTVGLYRNKAKALIRQFKNDSRTI